MREIFNFFTLYSLYKFANKQGAIAKLEELGASPDIIEYTKNLEDKFCGIVVGEVIKNKEVSLEDIKPKIEKKQRVELLKAETAKSIKSDFPDDIEKNLKNWAILQIKKDNKNRALFLNNLQKIQSFLQENKDIDLTSYDLQSLLDYIDQLERFGKSDSQDIIDRYLTKSLDFANQKMMAITNPSLINWAKKRFLSIAKEWEKSLRKAIQEKPFEQLLLEADKMKEDIDNGLYRGRELLDTPLRNGEYDSLISNLEFLDDWQRNTRINLADYSVKRAIDASNEWHKEMASSGVGLKYNPINKADIVYGPDNWKDEENKGFIILELKDENDLKVEGAKQNHCVGGYGEKIKKKQCRIFSLRNINNIYSPILTIETDMSGAIVRQDYGPGNSKIDQRFHDMVSEWESQNTADIYQLDSNALAQYIQKIKNKNILLQIVDKVTISVKMDDIEAQIRTEALACIIENPHADKEVLLRIINKNKNDHILHLISGSRNADKEILLIIMSKLEYEGALIAIVKNPSADKDILLQALNKTNSPFIISYIVKNPFADKEILLQALDKTNDDEDVISAILSYERNIDEEILLKIFNETNKLRVVRQIVNKINKNTLLNVIDKTNNARAVSLIGISQHPKVDKEILLKMFDRAKTFGENKTEILSGVAYNDKAVDKDLLLKILNETNDIGILALLAPNPAADKEILLDMIDQAVKSSSTHKDVLLISAASNPSADKDVLLKILDKTDNSRVLADVAINQSADTEILSRTIDKVNDPTILKRISLNSSSINAEVLSKIIKKFKSPLDVIVEYLMKNSNLSLEALEILVEIINTLDPELKKQVTRRDKVIIIDFFQILSKNPNISSKTIDSIINIVYQDDFFDKDNAFKLKYNLIQNPEKISEKSLQILIKDKDKYLSFLLIHRLLTTANISKIPENVLDNVFFKSNDYKLMMATNPNIPNNLLIRLSKDNDSEIRNKILDNPSIPLEVIKILVNDKNYLVRKKAKKKMQSFSSKLASLVKNINIFYKLAVN